ncbi:MAG: hypothetical protein OEZ65_07995 [Gemmatimonadota bacterium]|nr:hypothetical protein [Gemmatimonadota bacterium]MDH5759516.1 hypothetical protein [Gemmatimonadota bacterium]
MPETSLRPAPVGSRGWLLTFLVCGWGIAPGALDAQSLAGQALWPPRLDQGQVRFSLLPAFSTWDENFGPPGSDPRPLGAGLTSDEAAPLLPGVELLEARLRELTSTPGYAARAGGMAGTVRQDFTRVDFSGEMGVFDWLSVGVTVPIVKTRTEVGLDFQAAVDADLGLSPTQTDAGAVAAFLQAVSQASTSAASHAQAACSTDPGSATCSSAQALAQEWDAFSSGLDAAYGASIFFPVTSSDVAGLLTARLDVLNAGLSAAGLGTVGAAFPFAATPVDENVIYGLNENPRAGIGGAPFGTVIRDWTLGDIEVGARLRVLERGDASGLRYSLYVGGLVRLGTGTSDDPDVFLDLGSGDGQEDLEGYVTGYLQGGRRFSLGMEGRYGVQHATILYRRVAPAEVIAAPLSSRRLLEWTPGSYRAMAVVPRWYASPNLALMGSYRWFSRAADRYAYAPEESFPDLDLSIMEGGTGTTLHEVGLGLSYTTRTSARGGGISSTPVELHARVVRSVAGSGKLTPVATRAELGILMYRRVFGN